MLRPHLHSKPISPFPNHPPSLLLLPHLCQNIIEIRQIHSQIIKRGLSSNTHYSSKILAFYALPPISNLQIASIIFNHIEKPDSFSWNTMIRGHSLSNAPEEGLLLFYHMTHYPFLLDHYTFPFVIKACTRLLALEEGKQVHSWVIKLDFLSDAFVTNTLIDFYAKCALLEDAQRMFDGIEMSDSVAWNSLISAYVELGELGGARRLFDQMPKRDEFSWNTMIDGYARVGEMEGAQALFCEMPVKDVVSWNCLLGGYVTLGETERALELFYQMPIRNVVSWTTIILACVNDNRFEDGLRFFRIMQSQNVRANRITLLAVLPAIAHLGALALGDWVFAYIEKSNINLDDSLGSSLIDMYSRCGSIRRALHVFENIPCKGLYSWNSMILGHADNGQPFEAIGLFSQMTSITRLQPNNVTFVGLLKACSHGRLVEEGCKYFELMNGVYGISPDIIHYGCMVDLLGRAGKLREAEEFIYKMPMKPNAVIWNALLGACRGHNSVDIGERVAEQLIELDPNDSAPFVLLSNIYASYCRWDDVERIRKMMDCRGIHKTPGCSTIELNGVVLEFLAGDNEP